MPSVTGDLYTNNSKCSKPEKISIHYKLSVNADVVPEGEIIRCWLPFPRNENERQSEIKLHSVNSEDYIISPNKYSHKSIYLEKKAVNGKKTEFEFSLEYIGKNEFVKVNPDSILPYKIESDFYKKFTSERNPHISFSDKMKNLSQEIVGDEKNKFFIAKKIFLWINDNIPWAGAREYSTIENISDYCITNGHGDCGIKTLTFMTLARMNGIPTRWQSGWMLHPNEVNLHDWAEMYFEGYGWLPVDQSFGLIDSNEEEVKWYYFGNIDAYHLIVNDDYSGDLFPAKIYPRSETVDFQRGEVEWKGGNLYFDQWDYHMEVKYLK